MQYWAVGATWGLDDKFGEFCRGGYWEMGHEDEDQPNFVVRRDAMKAGDRIAIKKREGQGADTITIRAIGIVKGVHDGRVDVDWKLTDLDRHVACRNYFGTIHGPLEYGDEWVRETFCL